MANKVQAKPSAGTPPSGGTPKPPKSVDNPAPNSPASTGALDAKTSADKVGEKKPPSSNGSGASEGAKAGVSKQPKLSHGSKPPKQAKPSKPDSAPAPAPAPSPELKRQQRELGDAFSPKSGTSSGKAAARYFDSHDTYIDPRTGTRYTARYNDASGNLRLRRSNIEVSSDAVPGGADPNSRVLIEERARLDVAGPGGLPQGASLGSPAKMDERIVIAADGDRETDRTYSVHRADGTTIGVREHVSSTAGDIVTAGTVDRSVEAPGPDGGRITSDSTERYALNGQLTNRERSTTTTTGDGAITNEDESAQFVDGAPTITERGLHYRFDGVSADETTTTTFEGGKPQRSVIEQAAEDPSGIPAPFGASAPQRADRTIELEYDDRGRVVSTSGVEPADEDSPLTTILDDHPTAAGERFAFSQVRREASDEEDRPALVSGPGIVVTEGDVRIFQEGGRAGQVGASARQLAKMRATIRDTSDPIRGPLSNVDLLQDAYPGSKSVPASASGDRITYYNGTSSKGVFQHEVAHVSATGIDEGEWSDAIEADAGIDTAFRDGGDVVRKSDRVLLGPSKGVTPYADEEYLDGGETHEDIADSVRLWVASQRSGGLVTVRQPDGTRTTATFDELYPGRASILEGYYGPNAA